MGIKLEIEVLESGYFITVTENGEVIDKIASSYGAWNINKYLKKYLYPKGALKNKTTKKVTKKKAVKKSKKKVSKWTIE